MVTVTGYTATRMKAIEDASVVNGEIVAGKLILTRFDTTQIIAGDALYPITTQGTFATRPAVATAQEGQDYLATDQGMAQYRKISGAWVLIPTGPVVCTSTTRPAAPYTGLEIYETDTNRRWVYRSTAWNPMSSLVELRRAAALSVPSDPTSSTLVTWTQEITDVDAWHLANSGNVVVPDGFYGPGILSVTLRWQTNATGWRLASIGLAGTRVALSLVQAVSDSTVTVQTVSYYWFMIPGQILTVQAQQNSGAALNVESTNDDTTLYLLKTGVHG